MAFRDKASSHLIAVTLVICNVLISTGSDIHLPALPMLVKDLGTTDFLGKLVFIIFFIGASVSRFIWGPISDYIGRRKVMFLLLGIQIPSQYMCIVANNIETLLFWRAFQSLGAGVISVVGTAIIADVFKDKNRVSYFALLELSFPIAFIIAPILGAILLDIFDTWRAGFALVFIFLIIVFLLVYFIVPETRSVQIQEPFEMRHYWKVISDLRFFTYSTVSSLIIASYVLYVVNAPFIYIVGLKLGNEKYAVVQFLPMVFNLFGLYLYKLLLNKLSVTQVADIGLKALIVVIPLYLGIASGYLPMHAEVLVSAVCVQSLLVPFILPGLTSRSIDLFPKRKGLVSSCLGGFRAIYQVSITTLFSYFIGSNTAQLFLIQAIIVSAAISGYYYVEHKRIRSNEKRI
jgi:multidrug resistance protein